MPATEPSKGPRPPASRTSQVIETEGDEIIAVRRTGLSEEEKVGLALADNRTADLSEWDVEMLHSLSQEHDISSWFTEEDLEAFLGDEVELLDEMPELNSDDREPIQQMTFIVHDLQAEIIKEAIEKAKAMGPFVDTGNENGNGNAIARVAELFLSWGGDHGLS